MNTRTMNMLSLAFKAITVGFTILTIVLAALNIGTQLLHITFLAIGLVCLALASLTDHPVNR